ncbi:MFS transporter [Sneathiella glossodoripedis]|uniref:MFS transporter n=1 Tax=Sneathiella glossodoripedis TaxID=418853 RepID=UPI00046EE04C|nr:MFS transporter [Sneathiella glossodoripedis]
MSEPDNSTVIHRRAYYIFVISSVLFGLGQFHRLSGAVTIPAIAADLEFAVDSLGFIAAALFFTSAILQVPNGMLLDRFGPRRLVPLYVGAAVGGCLVLAYATTYEAVVLGRVLLGAGFSITMMSAYVLFARWFPADRFATIASWLMAASGVGSILASYPLSFFIDLFGWRPAYLIVAIFTLVAIVVGIWVVRDFPPAYKVHKDQPASIKDSIKGYMGVLKYPRFFYMLAMGFVAFGPATTILGMWGGPYLENVYGLSGVERGEILFLMVIAVPFGALFFGPLDRRFKSRKAIIMVAVFAEIIVFAILGLIPNLPLWSVCNLFVIIAFLQQHYVVLAAQCRASFPDHMVGRANSTLNLTSIMGVAFMQSLFGWGLLYSPIEGYRISFVGIALLLSLALILYIGFREGTPKKS